QNPPNPSIRIDGPAAGEDENNNEIVSAFAAAASPVWRQEARSLCREYIGHRLYRAGCMTPSLLYSLPPNAGSQTSQRLRRLCHRLELLHPAVFAQPLTGQLGLTLLPTNGVTDAVAMATIRRAYRKFARRLLSMPPDCDWDWGRPVALFCMAGAFAVDYASARMQLRLLGGRSCEQAIESLAECLSECLAECAVECSELFDWLTERGGWVFPDPETSAFANRSGQHDGATVWQKILARCVQYYYRLLGRCA
ncbi:hypothetical protein BOX15_Mlig022570g2, partial [Macrostomum lignano]